MSLSKIISAKDIIVIILIAALFSQVSWWVLINTEKVKHELNPQISKTYQEAGTPSLSSIPHSILLAFIAYMPFWLVAFTIIRIFVNIEKHRSMPSPIQQQEI